RGPRRRCSCTTRRSTRACGRSGCRARCGGCVRARLPERPLHRCDSEMGAGAVNPAVAAAFAVLLAAGNAFAQSPSPVPARVTFRTSGCDPLPVDEDAFARILRSELLADGVAEVFVAPASAPPPSADPSLATIQFDDACSAADTL